MRTRESNNWSKYGLGKDVSAEYEDGMPTIAGDKKTEIEDADVKYVWNSKDLLLKDHLRSMIQL